MSDVLYIKKALKLAARARGMTSPNPMVGAVIVKSGRVIVEAYHHRAGEPHAEALALSEAGDKAKGATLYVSLEPCCHTNKRTPPCTRAIIAAGIKRVVVATLDPNPSVAGKGVAELEAAGIKVVSGVLDAEARALNEAYNKFITTRKPFVILKAAMTLDGKIATPTGQSKWITGEKARLLVHKTRASVDAIMTAIGTVKADDPQMTARVKGARSPLRVVIDPLNEISLRNQIVKCPPDTLIVTKNGASAKADELRASGVKILAYEGELDMNGLMAELGRMGIISVLIEGGSSLNSHALLEGIVDKVMFFIAPKIIGGKDSVTVVGGKAFRPLEDAVRLRDMRVRRVGEDILLEAYVDKA